uniref:Uncharacterized protein n=1 Tax=Bionectria ochroleuca TaxID=29856 RepID=A0A8H7K6K6_BIOOC
MAPTATSTEWDHEYHTLRRENLFRNPPKDHTAYPALQAAVDPHIESFDRLFRDDGKPGLLAHGLADIGTKIYLDGDERAGPEGKNRISIRFKDVNLQRAQVPLRTSKPRTAKFSLQSAENAMSHTEASCLPPSSTVSMVATRLSLLESLVRFRLCSR